MNPFLFIYTEFLWRPLFNLLIFIYNTIPGHDFGLAVVLFTLIIRGVLTPIHARAQRAQRELAVLQPEIQRIQKEHKNNREAQSKTLMSLYAEHKVNPFSGCLLMLVQVPVLITLFNIFGKGLDPSLLSYLYSFVLNPGAIDPMSFGVLDLSKGNIVLGVLAAVTQFFQTKLSMPVQPPSASKNDFARAMQAQMQYVFPVLILVWSYTLPSALTLYWTVLNLIGIVQETMMKKKM
ncbi:MAG: membrane protein insertase YidC [Candidatus Sungbacteria bacterium]|nr:membrane protein insertase YidC [Candidatus Sungbacteria bacterium]